MEGNIKKLTTSDEKRLMILPICSERNTSSQPALINISQRVPHWIGIEEGDGCPQHIVKQLLVQNGCGTNTPIGKEEGSKESEHLTEAKMQWEEMGRSCLNRREQCPSKYGHREVSKQLRAVVKGGRRTSSDGLTELAAASPR